MLTTSVRLVKMPYRHTGGRSDRKRKCHVMPAKHITGNITLSPLMVLQNI